MTLRPAHSALTQTRKWKTVRCCFNNPFSFQVRYEANGGPMKKKSKTVSLKAVHCWRSAPPGTAIKLAAQNFVVLVRTDAAKKAGHPSLLRELDNILKQPKPSHSP